MLIYEQECATEKRRRRKRGKLPDPPKFAYINELVCEGCGDCSVESNCLSVEPKETPFGRKRRINLSSCNKDFSCLNGFCPSFVTVEGATRRKKQGSDIDVLARARDASGSRAHRSHDALQPAGHRRRRHRRHHGRRPGGDGGASRGQGRVRARLHRLCPEVRTGAELHQDRRESCRDPPGPHRSGRGRRADRLRHRGQLLAQGGGDLSSGDARRDQHRRDADRRHRAQPGRKSRRHRRGCRASHASSDRTISRASTPTRCPTRCSATRCSPM